jgi:hypothetical protein
LPPQLPPVPLPLLSATADKERIVVRGMVLDDSLNIPIQGAHIFIKGTKHGAVSNAKGEFSFSFASDWPPAQKGEFLLEVSASPFAFQRQLVVVKFKENPAPAPLTVRLLSLPERGFVLGKIAILPPPVAPPGARKSQP